MSGGSHQQGWGPTAAERPWHEAVHATHLASDGWPSPSPRRRGPGIGGLLAGLAVVGILVGLGVVVWKVETTPAPAITALGDPTPISRAELPAPVSQEWTDPTRPRPSVESATPLGSRRHPPVAVSTRSSGCATTGGRSRTTRAGRSATW